ncbi:MAG TPA: hypothetical protein PKD53_13175, partial [Chloroflexaceae bacterium]|nr:hypothetical protein [Chloroflexaceae bacterium]
LGEAPVAYGGVATRRPGIEEVDIDSRLPDRRYALWDFSTLPAWRGRGVYPRLLQAILRREAPRADWFEISHELGNDASRRGILRAGFHLSNQIVLTEEGQVRLAPTGDLGRAGESGMGQRIGMLPAAP